MKKALKITGITLLILLAIIIIMAIIGVSYFFISTNGVELDITKLDGNFRDLQIYDGKNNQIMLKNNNYTPISEISPYITGTFVSVEDKRFFDHNGIDMKRMLSAAVKNITSKSLKEGASTITQQLIKNTHLTNDKTFKRKLSEIRLALKLEKQLSKNEILEKYLNNIYFGSGIYGIHDACLSFFDKQPSDVNLAEAAILAGVVKNPSKNSPITNLEGANKRQKVIFSVLRNNKTYDENFISNAKNTQIILKNGLIHNKIYKSFINNAIFESTLLLNMDEKDIANSGYKIVTYLDSDLQQNMYGEINNYQNDCNYVRASIDNKTMGVTSYISNLNLVDSNISRQAGSLIKPFSVYMPCYENNLIFGLSQILDEPININGYSPQNFNNVYHGYVSVKDCVAQSYNVPAVKLLKEVGIQKSVEFLSRYDLNIKEQFKNLSLALGSNSVSPLHIAACYSSIANGGYFEKAKFVKQIIDKDGKVVYNRTDNYSQVVDSDVNYLMLDNLLEVTKTGTGKKLNTLPYQIACKTGTATNNNGDNTDAWCCAITTQNTFIAWDGAKTDSYLDKHHGGSSYPTLSVKDYANFVYSNNLPSDFEKPNSIVNMNVDKNVLYDEHIVKTLNFDSENAIQGIFSVNNLPQMLPYEIVDFTLTNNLFEDIIEFNGQNRCRYNIYYKDNEQNVLIESVVCNGDIVKIILKKANIFKHYDYYVEFQQEENWDNLSDLRWLCHVSEVETSQTFLVKK